MAEAEVEVKDAPAEIESEAPKPDEQEAVEAPAEPPQEEQTMRAVILGGHGGYSKLKIEKRPKPKATEGHVLIKVHACGQSFADLMQRQGMLPKFPKAPSTILGMECSGVVEEVGENVTGFEVGSRVCCLSWTGAFAEFVSVPTVLCYAMPESMSFEDGAAFPVNYLTAYFLLFHCGNLNRRKNVLIHCAAGGVGMAATQLCKTVEGVTVFGTASASKHDVIKKNGVDHPIDYRTEDYVEAVKKITDSVDLALDPLGGAETKKCYDLLSPLGALVIYGYASHIAESKGLFAGFKSWFAGLTFNPLKLMSDNKMVCGLAVEDIKPELMQEAMDVLLKMYQDGALKPHIDTVFAFEEVAKAHQKMHDRANIGKILLSPLKQPDPDAEPVKKRKRSFSKFHTEKPKIDKDKSAEDEKPKEDAKETTEKQEEAAKEEQKESTEASQAEAKEVKAEKPPEEAKEESKEEGKEEFKEQKEEPKEEIKEVSKEQTKEETKEEAKEEVKEEAKEETKEEAKEEAVKEEAKEETKEEAKEETKEEAKEEAVKDEAKEETKEEAKEETKEEDQQEGAERERKEEAKTESADQQLAEAGQQKTETKEENGEEDTEM